MTATFHQRLELSIQDPSGEIRTFPFQEQAWIGRSPDAPVLLRDPTAPQKAVSLLRASETEVWVRAEPQAPALELGSL